MLVNTSIEREVIILNKVIVSGNLGKDVEVRYSGDKAVARFSLAVRRRITKQGEQGTDWLNIVCFSHTAEFAEKYLHKGSKIILEGRISTGNYKDKDGNTRYTTDIIADSIEFAESKKEADANRSNAPANDDFNNQPDDSEDGFVNIPDDIEDELPFN